jgi:Transposase DDE domain
MRTQYTSFTAALTRFLSPQVWKQAHQCHRPKKAASRWDLHPLLMVLLLMTWTSGDSEAERFASARAFYVACHQHAKRPGQTLAGFQQALAKLPLPVLHALCAGVRQCLQQVFHRYWRSDGFLVLACDGSRLECPRSAALEKRLGQCGKKDTAPMLMVEALVLLPAGLLWSWSVGPGPASEHDLLRQLLPTLPRNTLLVADAFYQGYDLYRDLLQVKASFLVRLSSKSQLYTEAARPLERFREGLVWYWPEQAQNQQRRPLRVRLLRVRGQKHQDVWLLTNVLEQERLGRRRAAEIYRWRWRVEGVFRTYKRTLPKIKLCSRTEALVYREAEVSLLGLQVLLAQAATKQRPDGVAVIVLGSARRTLLRIRGEITTTLGVRLGPWQQRWYRQQLAEVRAGGGGRKVRRKWPRRKDHKAPKPPKLRVLPDRLRARINRQFQTK